MLNLDWPTGSWVNWFFRGVYLSSFQLSWLYLYTCTRIFTLVALCLWLLRPPDSRLIWATLPGLLVCIDTFNRIRWRSVLSSASLDCFSVLLLWGWWSFVCWGNSVYDIWGATHSYDSQCLIGRLIHEVFIGVSENLLVKTCLSVSTGDRFIANEITTNKLNKTKQTKRN